MSANNDLKLYATDDRILIHHVKNILQSDGIDCFIKNDLMYTLAGEVPVNEVLPEIWIKKSDQLDDAKTILNDILNGNSTATENWVCSHCNEKHEAQFLSCWKCGSEKEA